MPNIINGTSGPDNLSGTSGDDSINGGAGDDTVHGGAGNDTIDGGAYTFPGPHDELYGEAGDDNLIIYPADGSRANPFSIADGGTGYDIAQLRFANFGSALHYVHNTTSGTVTCGRTAAQLFNIEAIVFLAGSASDQITGGVNADWLFGNEGDDTLDGGGGDDTINGGAGNDSLTGGGGADVFAYNSPGFGNDRIADFDVSRDRLDLSALGITDFLTASLFLADSGNDTTFTLAYNGSQTATLVGVKFSQLSAANFIFDATTTAYSAAGTSAPNLYFGAQGNDTLGGGLGDDTITGAGGSDILSGGADDDLLIGGAGNDAIDGGTGIDRAVYGTTRAAATVTRDAALHKLVVTTPLDGTDQVKGVELFFFNDGLYSFNFATASTVLANFGGQQGWTSQAVNQRALADVNGDGRLDIVGFGYSAVRVAIGNGDGTFQAAKIGVANFGPAQDWDSQDHYPRLLADVNGDGRADIVGFGYAGAFVAMGKADGTFADTTLAVADFGGQLGWTSQDTFQRTLRDVNGDGKLDIVGFGGAAVFTALGNGDGSFQASRIALADMGPAEGWASQSQYPRQLADVNGDGKLDIVGFGQGAVFTALGNGDGTFQASKVALADMGVSLGWTSQNAFPRMMADVNGDGRADIVGFGYGGASVALAKADGTFNAATLAVAAPAFGQAQGWTSQDATPRQLIDLNHDGVLDILGFGPDGTSIAYGNGDGTFALAARDLANFGLAQGWNSDDTYLHQVADLNGDGLPDIVGFGYAGVKVAMNQGDVLL